MHKESTYRFGQLKNIDLIMIATLVVNEMRRYIKMDDVEVGTMQIENL